MRPEIESLEVELYTCAGAAFVLRSGTMEAETGGRIFKDNPAHRVFRYLGRFLECRGLVAVEKSADGGERSRDRFVAELHSRGYFRLDAVEPKTKEVTTIILLSPQGQYTSHAPQLRSLVGSLDIEASAKTRKLCEVIVIVPPLLLKKKNMTLVIKEFRERYRREGVGAKYYNMYGYPIFSFDVPRAQCIPRPEIVPPDEVEEILSRERISKNNIKKMEAAREPPVVWIGGRPGQVVRTVAVSETAGRAYDYWLLIPNRSS